jgi:hypothetical protein
VHPVDQAGTQVLLDGGGTTTDADVGAAGRGERLLQRRADVVDEVEGGASLHLDRFVRVVGQHEDGVVVGRLGSPPVAFLPWRTHRSGCCHPSVAAGRGISTSEREILAFERARRSTQAP